MAKKKNKNIGKNKPTICRFRDGRLFTLTPTQTKILTFISENTEVTVRDLIVKYGKKLQASFRVMLLKMYNKQVVKRRLVIEEIDDRLVKSYAYRIKGECVFYQVERI